MVKKQKIVLIGYIKTDGIYKDTADIETRSDTSNQELDGPFSKGKNKTVIGLTKYLEINEIKYPEKNKINKDSYKRNCKEIHKKKQINIKNTTKI